MLVLSSLKPENTGERAFACPRESPSEPREAAAHHRATTQGPMVSPLDRSAAIRGAAPTALPSLVIRLAIVETQFFTSPDRAEGKEEDAPSRRAREDVRVAGVVDECRRISSALPTIDVESRRHRP